MSDKIQAQHRLSGRYVDVEGIPVYVVEGGTHHRSSVLFLHGWPENWAIFEPVMSALSAKAHVVALDFPGIGASKMPPASNDKRTLAKYVRGVIDGLGQGDVTLVGHDIGGQVVYAFLHVYPQAVRRAVIMNVVVPGVDPWADVVRNPQIWHFGFHAVPGLPETLVAGRQAEYFAFFYDRLSRPGSVSEQVRAEFVHAYARLEALRTGFAWYRAFPQDEEDNLRVKAEHVQTPMLYLRGEREEGDLDRYVNGLRESGLQNIHGALIARSGHFAPVEEPDEVVGALSEFMELEDSQPSH